MNENTVEMVSRYRALAVAWANAKTDPEKANRILREHHAVYKTLRESAAGRTAITSLLEDDEPAVRYLAATHSLAWNRELAERLLDDLAATTEAYSFDAKWTLRAFRKGELNLDW